MSDFKVFGVCLVFFRFFFCFVFVLCILLPPFIPNVVALLHTFISRWTRAIMRLLVQSLSQRSHLKILLMVIRKRMNHCKNLILC